MNSSNIKKLIDLFAYFPALLLICLGNWIESSFGKPSFEQILYHISENQEGLLEADHTFINSFVAYCIVGPILGSFGIFFLKERQRRSKKLFCYFLSNAIKIQNNSIHLILNRLNILFNYVFLRNLPIKLFILAALFLFSKISLYAYLVNQEYKHSYQPLYREGILSTNIQIDDEKVQRLVSKNNLPAELQRNHDGSLYIEPNLNTITPPIKKKNLILIYAESLETTYSRDDLVGRDLLKSIEALQGGTSFNFYAQTGGTGWTIGGIVATQCGFPLRPTAITKNFYLGRDELNGNSLGEKASEFLPNAVCLGDILKRSGYKNIFLGGASLNFSGKGKFLTTHGYEKNYGREEWLAKGETEMNEWGLHDDRLFAQARIQLDELEQGSQPFNLTILTSDTHHPIGFTSKTCKSLGTKQDDFRGIVECSAQTIAGFIKYAQRYSETTDIVVMGDHLAMTNPLIESLNKAKVRFIYNKFYSLSKLQKNREILFHFSMYPTILSMLGFDFPINRLALGASGFGYQDPSFINIGYEKIEKNETDFKRLYQGLWEAKK